MAQRSRPFGAIAAVFCAIAICGSLAPFTFRAIPWPDALERVEIPDLRRLSRSDLIANVALFVPIGFFLMGAWQIRRGALDAAARVVVVSAVLSATLETMQLYTPSRTSSLADFAAEQAGAIVGLVLWTTCGDALDAAMRGWMADREQPGPFRRALIAYVALWSLARLFPFDATLDVHQLAQRVRDGRVVLAPFGGHIRPVRMAMQAALALPVGMMLAALGWPPARATRRHALAATIVAVVFALAVGAGQALVDSQSADVSMVILDVAGAAMGAAIVAPLMGGAVQRPSEEPAS